MSFVLTTIWYTVNLVAADEHRANFSLVDIRCITGKEGGGETNRGIELYLPGVHCDVGGSYQNDKPEAKTRIDAFDDYNELKALKYELIRQGWFTEEELIIHDDACKEIITRLNTHQKYTFQDPPVYKQPDIVYDPNKVFSAITDYYKRQAAGQKELNEKTELKNKDLKELRHKFLHWNSVYGEGIKDSAIQP